MRRIYSYIVVAAAVVLGIGVTANSILTDVNSDYTYEGGQRVGFRLSAKGGKDVGDISSDAAEEVATEMSNRLATWGVTTYDVTTYGNDTIEVTFSADNSNEYGDIARYLIFSGENFSISDETEAVNFSHEEMFANSTARIEYKDYAPIVVIPVSDGAKLKEQVDDLVSSKSENKTEGEEEETIAVYIWSDKVDGDTIEDAQKNPNMAKKVLVSLNAENLFYQFSETENTELQIICGSATEQGYYDPASAAQGYYSAQKIVNMFNASKLNYDIEIIYSETVNSYVEDLVVLGEHSISLAWSRTLIATLVAIAIVALILVLFFKLAAVGPIICSLAVTYLSLVFFVLLGNTFNIAAIIGFILVGLTSLVAGVHYLTKLKEEVYKGKSLKKSNIEASKRNTMVVVDGSIISLVAGIFLYVLGGSLASQMGIVLVFGAVLNIIINLFILKLMMNLLANSNKLQRKYSFFGIDEKNVGDMLSESKDFYEGAYAKKDLTKKNKITGIVGAGICFVGMVMAIIFGATTGSIYNLSTSKVNSKMYFELIDDASGIKSKEDIVEELKLIYLDNAQKDSLESHIAKDAKKEYTIDQNQNVFYDEALEAYATIKNFYIVSFDNKINENTTLYRNDGTEIADLKEYFLDRENKFSEDDEIAIKDAKNYANQTLSKWAIFGTLFSAIVICVYFVFRFSPSKAVSAFITSVGAGFIAISLFVITRIVTTDSIALAGIFACVLALLLCSILFTKDKEIRKDIIARKNFVNENDKESIMVKSVGISASITLLIGLVTTYLGINFFAFGPTSYLSIFGSIVVITLATVFAVVNLSGPLYIYFEKLFSKIKFKQVDGAKRAQKRAEAEKKNKSAEPEESPVIGINI